MDCPFCKDDGYDAPGLAYHIKYVCEAAEEAWNYFIKEATARAERLAARREAE